MEQYNKNIIQLFEIKARAHPNKIACIFQNTQITYSELNNRANQLARFIKKQKIIHQAPIAVYLERSSESIISFLAIMKLGLPYIPIDKDISPLQFSNILSDADISLILTSKEYIEQAIAIISNTKTKVILLDQQINEINQEKDTNLQVFPAENLAYILFTSGTTGKPKGVQISHSSIVNLLISMTKELNINENDMLLSITPFSFDLSVPDIYLPLINGGSFIIADTMARFDPNDIIHNITKYPVTLMQATPASWQMLVNEGWKNESNIKIISGGEALTNQLANELRLISNMVWNFYGPTETTVWSTSYKITNIDTNHPIVSIGKPIANTQIYILNKKLQQQPIGTPGELYIGGAGIAIGYLNRPELNIKSFITNPFSKDKKSRLYKTGDLVIQNEAGNLHYLGRIDTQIKIRGHRIEASAIESVLVDYQGIKECVILDKNPEQQQELVAYLIISEETISLTKLQKYLKTHFPNYMVPTRYVIVDKFPLTHNGKIDRKKIPNIVNFRYLSHKKSNSPLENRYEEILMGLVQSLLQREDINLDSNFFDLGLHSISLLDMAQTLNRILNQPINVLNLYQYPTIRSFASFLIQNQNIDYAGYANSELKPEMLLGLSYMNTNDNQIAVVGMACKVPGADDYRGLWDLIIEGKETIQFFTEEELKKSGVPSEHIQQKAYIPARGILNDIDKFDADFFGYTPAEAKIMEPQHRVFLEQSWSALEDAGYIADIFPGKIGVFAGMNDSSYLINHLLQNPQIKEDYDPQQLLLATSTHYLSTKVAYAMGLKGPSLTINTACSTGLVSIATACNSLINNECDMALAGAVTIITPQQSGYFYQELGILSPDGHCRVFDAQAHGTVLSNGCGVVVLRRLSDALKNNDHILGVIKGWALNNDGTSKAGFTAPSIDGQVACVKEALMRAKISPTEIEYLEAHGTGTLIGDPIEISSLSKAYDYDKYQKSQYCALGSIKANIGHTDTASGVIGFIKTILTLSYKTLPPQIHFSQNNSNIDFTHSPFYVSCSARPWETEHKNRTAAVHSLGFGGTNAHVIVQEAPKVKTTHSKSANLFILSAKTEKSLIEITKKFHNYLLNVVQNESANQLLADIAYTLQMGRKAFQWRTIIPYQSDEHLIHLLNKPTQLQNHSANHLKIKPKRVIFGFVGQGSQYTNMAVEIYQNHPYFKQIIDECCIALQPDLEIDLRNLLFPKTPEDTLLANEQLHQTQYTQPALFIIEYALAQFLISLGIKPHAMIGHSVGEYVAATLSGVLSLQDALKLITIRSKLMASTEPGVMLAVPLSIEQIEPYLSTEVELAVHNTPTLCVVAGTDENITQFQLAIQSLLEPNGLECRMLKTSHAFHSYLMTPILHTFYEMSLQYTLSDPNIPYISNVTGKWISREDLSNTRYWTTHLRNTVLFSTGLESLKLNQQDVFIEIGPGNVLSQLILQHNFPTNPLILQTLPNYTEHQLNSYEYFLNAIGKLWLHHLPIQWEHLYTNEIRQRCPLPTYAFEKKSYWVDPTFSNKYASHHQPKHENTDLFYKPIWKRDRKLSIPTKEIQPNSQKCWIIFCNDKEKLNHLSAYISEKDSVYVISSGITFQQSEKYLFVIHPEKKEDYIRFLKTISLIHNECYVLHTWYLHGTPPKSRRKFLADGPYGLLYFIQAFNEVYASKYLKILILTTGIYNVLGNEVILPMKATILGPCKVIPQEQENIAFKLIDLESKGKLTSPLINHLYKELELISQDDCKEEIAYRGGYRWIKRLESCDQELQASHHQRLKHQGVYIITGGLGGIGLSIAAYLAKKYKAHLILLARSELPPENKWHSYVNDPNHYQHQHIEKVRKLLDIKEHAKTLVVKQVNIEDKEILSGAIQAIKKQFKQINGVIHAAGIAGSGIAQLKKIEAYEAVIKPKLDGTHNLITCLKDEPLDMIVFISSITAITGFPGQIDYCSANCALDAYAHLNKNFTHPVFCTTINWLAWREVGMAAQSNTMLIKLNEHNSIDHQEGCEFFEKVVNSDLNQVIIAKENLDFYEIPQMTSHEIKEKPIDSTNVIAILSTLWQKTLGREQIDIDDDFYELGGHSLLAINLLNKIQHHFDIKLPSTTLFQAKTIRSIATIIESYHQEHERYSPLVILRQGDAAKPPLFMVHPIGGTVFCYVKLTSYLDTDRTIYAFQDPSIEAEKTLFSSIEEIALFYLEHIQKIQKKGPYYLCGASFGALVISEIAYLLEQQHETIYFVGLIDGWGIQTQTEFDINYIRQIIHLHHHKNTAPDKQPFWESLLKQRLNMMLKYQYKKIQSQFILFKSLKLLPEYQPIDAYDNHWSQFSTVPMLIFQIPGDHNSMLQDPNVKKLARQINKYL